MSRKNSTHRGLRGGSYDADSWFLRSTFRSRRVPVLRFRYYGFRIVVIRRKQ
jgi:formylglycine-generating enzyme required for sulfatase activity